MYYLVHGKIGLKWLQMGPGVFFPTNPDLANILGRTDFDFENFCFWRPKFPDFLVPDFQISRNLAWATLGPGWASLGPGQACRHGSSAERIYRICLNILVWFRISAQAVFSSCLEHLYILFLISNFLAAADGAKDKKSKSNLFSLRLLLEKVCMGL